MFLLAFLISCNGGEMSEKTVQFPSIKDVPASSWEKLAQKKIYFGHQSVGYNIIEGMKDLMSENPQIRLNIIETSSPSEFNAPLFAHSRVGKNRDPKSKIDAFVNFFENGIGNKADNAFLKLCFVDVTTGTEVQKVFNHYKNYFSNLKIAYPETILIHVTVPLTSKQTGLKGWIRSAKNFIKKIIGRPFSDYHENIERNQFNELLRKEYDGKETIFDLALIESTFPNGKRSSFTKDGKTYYSMVPEYTHDGGHLNETGRKKVAEQLLILLAQLNI